MYLVDSDEQTELRQELRQYFASIMTPRIRHELRSGPGRRIGDLADLIADATC